MKDVDVDVDVDVDMNGNLNESPATCGVERMDCKVARARVHGLG